MRLFGMARTRANGIEHDRQGNLQGMSRFLTAYLRSGREPGKTWIYKTWIHKTWIQRAGRKSVRPSATFGPG